MDAMFGIKAWFRRLLFVPLAALVLANVPAVCAEKTAVFAVGEKELVAWEKTLSDYEAGTLNVRIPHTVLPEPPPVLARLLADDGCGSDLCIIIHKSILDKTFGKTASKFTGDFHKIALADMRKLPEELANPIAVFDSAHGNGDKVVLTAFKDTETGESVIVAIKINVPGNTAGSVNAVASVHGRQIGSFHKWLKDGLLRYYHTKKFPQWLVSVGVQNPRASIPRGNEILTEKDFRKSAFPAKKRNRKTSKSAFFKNEAVRNGFVFCGNGLARALSGLEDCAFPFVGRRFALPYATAGRTFGACAAAICKECGIGNYRHDEGVFGGKIPLSANGALSNSVFETCGVLSGKKCSACGSRVADFVFGDVGIGCLAGTQAGAGTNVFFARLNRFSLSANGALSNSVGQSEATPYVANNQQLSPERA